jgi:hypothetical protein
MNHRRYVVYELLDYRVFQVAENRGRREGCRLLWHQTLPQSQGSDQDFEPYTESVQAKKNVMTRLQITLNKSE